MYTTESDCVDCARNTPKKTPRTRLEILPTKSVLVFIGLNIFGLLSETASSNQHLLIMTECDSKEIQAVPRSVTNVGHMVSLSFDHRFEPYDIPAYILTNIGKYIVWIFLKIRCNVSGGKTSYHKDYAQETALTKTLYQEAHREAVKLRIPTQS